MNGILLDKSLVCTLITNEFMFVIGCSGSMISKHRIDLARGVATLFSKKKSYL
jgi:Mg-chelatase subunit ChlD